QLRARLQEGQSLSDALAGLHEAPPVLIAAVRAGERTSNLAEALDEYLRFDELLQRLRRKVVSAAIYPALVTGLGIFITVFLLIVVMPGFARMYQNLRGKAGGLTGWLIELSLWVNAHRTATLAVVLAAAAAGIWALRSAWAPRLLARGAVVVPWLRARIHDFQLAMLYQSLALLLKGGYPMVEALEIAGRSSLGSQVGAALVRARASIMQGSRVSQALMAAGLCDEVGRRLMAAAERNGEFPRAAEVVAQMHGERFELFVERLTRIVEPALLLAVAVMVGGIVVAMYLPVFDMATRLR
ncbi:MAG: type II secretion system F family protein, partial [Burkholderiaceae bacterium]|nr:type II secretion system F family protein [Burkholderiaceae bacterium]